MNTHRLLGVALLFVAGILLYLGYYGLVQLGDQSNAGFSERLTDSATWYLVLGVPSAVSGLIFTVKKPKRTPSGRLEFGKKVLP